MTQNIFGTGSVLLLLLVLLAGFFEYNQEWKQYQREFFRLKTQLSGPSGSETDGELKIIQIVNPDLGIVDRCPTCHLAVEDSRFSQAPEPFRTHPDFNVHQLDRIGCTICHSGQGRATTKEAAHGNVAHWKHPLLEKEFLGASCVKCHKGNSPILGPGVRLGKKLFVEKACLGCHRIDRQGGTYGPDLTTIGEKRTAHWLIEHFRDPQRVVPGSRMPPLKLSQEEIKILTTFMLSRVKLAIPDGYLTVRTPDFALARPDPQLASPTVQLGAETFKKFGCIVCHGPNGVGGIPNPNSMDGVVPELKFVAEGLFPQEILKKITFGSLPEKKTPDGPDPLFIMPAWRGIITDVEAQSLVEYLQSLLPKEAAEDW